MPALLDVDESSWLIGELSAIFEAFFLGGNGARGIIASRYFRRPRLSKLADVSTFEIRPFSEVKISKALEGYEHVSHELARELISRRPDLVPLARNPFTCGLIVDYLNQDNPQLPKNQSEIYETYIQRRLNEVSDLLEEHATSKNAVVDCAVDIAGLMFSAADVGLEIGLQDLTRNYQRPDITGIIDVLVAARIGRCSSYPRSRFSFVHRRFNEYFFVQHLLREGGAVSLDAIPIDSKWRDALVLYTEVADQHEAERIAAFCWEQMQANPLVLDATQDQKIRHVHCLRFLCEAFRARTSAVQQFSSDLFDYILAIIGGSDGLLFKKLAVEAAGLLPQDRLEAIIIPALSLDNRWLSETAFNACRYVATPSNNTINQLRRHLLLYSSNDVIRRYKEIAFSLELSPGLSVRPEGLRVF